MKGDSVVQLFERFVPLKAAPYCARLYDYFGFEFQIKKARQTKLGDYRYDGRTKLHTITINNDLNPFAFLITYLHEVAHLMTFRDFGKSVSPHGKEWKSSFKKVAKPVLSEEVFPSGVLSSLRQYLKNPKAASCSDPVLYEVLKSYNKSDDTIFLKSLSEGDHFLFNNKTYQYLRKQRTRIVCLDKTNNRKYLINQLAEVKRVEKGK